MNINELTESIIAGAYEVHNTLGAGFLEKVYVNALEVELCERGLAVERNVRMDVLYKGHNVGEYYADMIVEKRLIVEVKAVQNLIKEHEVQLVNYLTATKIEDGLLLNFGGFSVQIKRKYRTYRAKKNQTGLTG